MNLLNEQMAVVKEFPPPGEVFLVDLGDDGFHRVVRGVNVSIVLFLF